MFREEREDAVSPVIGVILMVAITVILAAVIAAFVFGMAGGVQKTKSVAATARHTGNDIVVTWNGGPDNVQVSYYNITFGDGTGPIKVPGTPPVVGNSTKGPGAPYTGSSTHITVTAVFNDGSAQVVLDSTV
jgi:flagellin-like protein